MSPLRRRYQRARGAFDALQTEPALEEVYRHLFTRDLSKLGEEDRFYPVGGAANYSLLYIILRIANDLNPKTVLDIGAGQSSLLWNMMRRHGKAGTVTTLENDAGWAEAIGRQVDHEILVTPLETLRIGAVQTHTYDWPQVRKRGPFDVIICDGPRGTPRFSRSGILSLIDETLPENMVLVLDDVERSGEQDTVDLLHERFRHLDRDYSAGSIRAAKSQMIFATGTYSSICHI